MTLNTSVAIGKPHNVHEIFAFCRKLLDTPEDVEPLTGERPHGVTSCRYIANPGGIGLPAWLWIYYGIDGPLRHVCDKFCATEVGGEYGETEESVAEHAKYLREDPIASGWAAIEVTFDTSYGYRGPNGEDCSDLHARLVTALGQWLDAKGLPWKWQNEHTGEWFDRYDQLAEFGNAHRATGADDWFRNVVLPAIASGALGGQS